MISRFKDTIDIVVLFTRRVLPALVLVVVLALGSLFLVGFRGPSVFGGYLWDSQRSLPVTSMVFGRFFWVFGAQIVLVSGTLFLVSMAFAYLAGTLRVKRISPRVNPIVFVLSSTPTFIGTLFLSQFLWRLPKFVLVVLAGVLFNLVFASFLRSQRRFLRAQFNSDYIVSARLRGGCIFANTVRATAAHALETIGTMVPLIVASLVVAERVNNYHAGLANFVFSRFSMFLDSPSVNPFGLTYLIWLIALSYAVQAVFVAFHAVITRHRDPEQRTDRILPVTIRSGGARRGLPARSRSTWRLRPLGTAGDVRTAMEQGVVLVIALLIGVLALLGGRWGGDGSFIARLTQAERDLGALRDARPSGPYSVTVDQNGEVALSGGSTVSQKGFEEPAADGDDTVDSGSGLFGGGSLLSEIEGGPQDTRDLPPSAQETMNEIGLLGISSWSPVRLNAFFRETPELKRYFLLGTNRAGASVLGTIVRAAGAYVVPLCAALGAAVFVGLGLALLGGFLLFRGPRVSRGLFAAVDTFDSIPKFLLVLLSLPLIGSVGREQNMLLLIMLVTGFALFPIVFKTVYHHIRSMMAKDFPLAEGMLGATAGRIIIYHIFFRTAWHPFLGAVLEVLGVTLLIESTLGFLDLVRGRYVSLGALVPSQLVTVDNPWEIWAPVLVIQAFIVGVFLTHQLVETGTWRGFR